MEPRFGRDVAGLSPVVGTVLILSIVISVIAVVFAVAVPQVQRLRAEAEADSARNMMLRLEGRAQDLSLATTTRSDEVALDLPAGGLRVQRDRGWWVLSWTQVTGSFPWNFTLLDLGDGDHSFNATSLAPPPGTSTIRAEPTLWANRTAEALDPWIFSTPAVEGTSEVRILRDGAPHPVGPGLLQVRFVAQSDGSPMGEAWVAGTDSLRYEANLYDGTHVFELLHGALVADQPDGEPRLMRHVGVQRRNLTGAETTVVGLHRLHAPPGVAPSAGAGLVVVPLTGEPAQALVRDGARDLTVQVHGGYNATFQADVQGTDGFRATVHPLTGGGAFERTWLAGTHPLILNDHLVRLPEGLKRG